MGFFDIIAYRKGEVANDAFLAMLVERTTENEKAYELLQECLGLRQVSPLDSFNLDSQPVKEDKHVLDKRIK